MSRRGERDLRKEQFWRQQVRQWRRSGLSIRGFCRQHGLAEASFYAWRRTLAERVPLAQRRPRPQPANGTADQPPAFVPVQVVPAPPAAPLEIVLGPGRVVRVPPGFDAATLRQLLATLEAPPC
jgi:transposase-like protein